jgi:putative nucleotidyltransferase with HDIG domain
MILDRLELIQDIPALLTISTEIDRLMHDPSTSADDIANVIKLDPALTGKVLKIANSAIYASTQRIVSLSQAVSRLGFSEIRAITLSIAFMNVFKSLFVNYEKFWLHSITCAFLSMNLHQAAKAKGKADRLFTCGILHDIGILILDQYFSDLYKKVFDISTSRRFDLQLVEERTLGITHSEVGAFLLRKWKLPDEITDVIEYHHQPQLAKISTHDAKIVYLANFIANNRGIDNGTGFFPEGFYDDIWDELNIDMEIVPELIQNVEMEVAKAKELLKLGGRS